MVLHGIHRHLPAPYRVTILAGRAELAAVDIGVAIGAQFPHLGEHLADVTLIAGHVFVQAAQRELGLSAVVELGLGSDRLPGNGSVAALTRHGQWAMWIGGLLRGVLLCPDEACNTTQQCQN